MFEMVEILKTYQLTISSCESFTAGLFCSEIANIPGASSVLKGGLVTYTNEAKMQVANVHQDTIRRFGAVSEQCVIEMAKNVKDLFQSDIGVSFSGNAGPQPSEEKPVGLLYCAIAYKEDVYVFTLHLQESRNKIREEAVMFIAKQVSRLIQKRGK